MSEEIEPISAEEARAILTAAIRERLGEDWEDEDDGWTRITGHDYMARLNKGRTNLDFYVDLLGEVTVEEREINPGQDMGRMLAWMSLLGSLLLALLIAHLSGYFS
jgi:hypothetical protein